MSGLDLLKAIEAIATLIALGIGGTWAYIKLVRRREHAPRIEFTVDIAFIGIQADYWLVELLAFVDNKGLVRHLIREFAFDLRVLERDDPVRERGERMNWQNDRAAGEKLQNAPSSSAVGPLFLRGAIPGRVA